MHVGSRSVQIVDLATRPTPGHWADLRVCLAMWTVPTGIISAPEPLIESDPDGLPSECDSTEELFADVEMHESLSLL